MNLVYSKAEECYEYTSDEIAKEHMAIMVHKGFRVIEHLIHALGKGQFGKYCHTIKYERRG